MQNQLSELNGFTTTNLTTTISYYNLCIQTPSIDQKGYFNDVGIGWTVPVAFMNCGVTAVISDEMPLQPQLCRT